MSTVLITGASGFIGWHLACALQQAGLFVRGLVRSSSKVEHLNDLGVKLVIGDVTQPESLAAAVQNVDAVFHLAGQTKALRPDQLDAVNADGCHHVAEACANAKVQQLVCVSSLAAVGPAASDQHPVDERSSPQPISAYGRSKFAGERALLPFTKHLHISIVRPPIVFGEFDRATLEMYRSIYRARLHLIPGYRPKPFSIIHAVDLADLLLRVSDQGERLTSDLNSGQGIYFAEAEERPTYGQIGELMGASVSRRFLKVPIGAPVLRLAGWASDRFAQFTQRSQYFSSDKVREAVSGPWICSADKARSQLGFQTQNALSGRFQQTGRWYLQQGWL